MTKTATLKHDALFSIKEHLHTVQESETSKMVDIRSVLLWVFFLFSISFSDYNDCFKTTYANRCFFFSFIQITDAFDSSATLLNHAYRKQGLTVDAVDDVMEKTAEVAYYLHLVLFSCP